MGAKRAETVTETVAETEKTAEAETKAEQKFTLEKLQANCRRLFDVSSSTFAGATVRMTGEYTVSEIKEAIEKWQKKEAK